MGFRRKDNTKQPELADSSAAKVERKPENSCISADDSSEGYPITTCFS